MAPNGTLVFSFIGFATQEVAIGNRTTVNVQMVDGNQELDEVIVTGLATSVKRSNSANAVATLSAKTLTGTTLPVTADGAMQGKLAGANIQSNGSLPGGGFNVQLRGVSTLGSSASQPLYIVDGVYIDNGQYSTGRSEANKAGTGSSTASQDNNANRLADLNPDDIESMEVLKGSSASRYLRNPCQCRGCHYHDQARQRWSYQCIIRAGHRQFKSVQFFWWRRLDSR